jgi:hypothetical protein
MDLLNLHVLVSPPTIYQLKFQILIINAPEKQCQLCWMKYYICIDNGIKLAKLIKLLKNKLCFWGIMSNIAVHL